jgi:enoyl-CoA hydratase/carnithine racemase
MTASDEIIVRTGGPVGYIELDRPQRANAYRDATLAAIEGALTSHVAADAVRLIVLASSTGGVFCSGADLDELGRKGADDALHLESLRVFDAIAACPKPTLAVIDGPAVAGGLELALACDLRLASERARFAMPETSLGIIPAAGATFRLARVVGDPLARQMILLGSELDAAQALRHGLVAEVVASGDLEQRVQWWAARAAGRDPLATSLAKQALAAAADEGTCRRLTAEAQAELYQRRNQPEEPDS